MHESTHPAGSGDDAPARFEAAVQVLRTAIERHAFPGCAFGVLAGGETVFSGALGHFVYEEGAPEVTPETVFDVASVTKVASTTAMAMLLNQRGKLDVDLPLGEVLPGFVIGRPRSDLARHVTLRNLLAHNSGLPGYAPLYKTAQTPAQLIHECLELPLAGEPGSRAEYSDPGFILLGKALEVITGEPLAKWTHREIFTPLEMTSTRFHPSPHSRPLIPPTEEDTSWRHRRIQGEVQDENAAIMHGVAGHAGLFSNVPDLLRFAGAIVGAGKGSDSAAEFPSMFHAKTVAKFAERQTPEGSSRALGWDTPSENSTAGRHFPARSIGHLGFSGCSLWIDLEAHIVVVLLTNRTWPDRSSRLIREIWPAFHDAIREAL